VRAREPGEIDGVVGHHLNPFASGVARFNQILAERLGVEVHGLFTAVVPTLARPLLSFKFSELAPDDGDRLAAMQLSPRFGLFLHDWAGSPLEQDFVERAENVWCGNKEVLQAAQEVSTRCTLAWAPGLIRDTRRFEPTEIAVFSFGMAHKIRTAYFARLRELLEQSGRSYAVYLSTANHETATLADGQAVYDEMRAIFPRGLYFMGNLSDVAISDRLDHATYFAAFFHSGARANNTSIASAMEHGAVVITNLDDNSPEQFEHMDNVLDISQLNELPRDPMVLRRIGVRAMETAREFTWERLVAVLLGSETRASS